MVRNSVNFIVCTDRFNSDATLPCTDLFKSKKCSVTYQNKVAAYRKTSYRLLRICYTIMLKQERYFSSLRMTLLNIIKIKSIYVSKNYKNRSFDINHLKNIFKDLKSKLLKIINKL